MTSVKPPLLRTKRTTIYFMTHHDIIFLEHHPSIQVCKYVNIEHVHIWRFFWPNSTFRFYWSGVRLISILSHGGLVQLPSHLKTDGNWLMSFLVQSCTLQMGWCSHSRYDPTTANPFAPALQHTQESQRSKCCLRCRGAFLFFFCVCVCVVVRNI